MEQKDLLGIMSAIIYGSSIGEKVVYSSTEEIDEAIRNAVEILNKVKTIN